MGLGGSYRMLQVVNLGLMFRETSKRGWECEYENKDSLRFFLAVNAE